MELPIDFHFSMKMIHYSILFLIKKKRPKTHNHPTAIILNNPNDPEKIFNKFRDLGGIVKCRFGCVPYYGDGKYSGKKITASEVKTGNERWSFQDANDQLCKIISRYLNMQMSCTRRLCFWFKNGD
jgi:hypothetical protein